MSSRQMHIEASLENEPVIIPVIKIETRQNFYEPKRSSDVGMMSNNGSSEFGEEKMKQLVNDIHAMGDLSDSEFRLQ